jgi:ubiquitin-small subunit ribosomal protein S27Ae
MALPVCLSRSRATHPYICTSQLEALPPLQTYTKPKKIKHKHKNVKLRVLKYYKVEDSGKVTRTRKQCPSETCGAGIFMATHKDRVHCGKCKLTFIHADK